VRPPRVVTVRIGLWCMCDTGALDGAVVRRVVETELLRRLPGASVAVASSGSAAPTVRDGGSPAERLEVVATGSAALVVAGRLRSAEDAGVLAAHSLVALQGVSLQGEAAPPAVAGTVHCSARDAQAQATLRGAGVPVGDEVPHQGVLLRRALSAAVVSRRVAHWRYVGALPAEPVHVVVDAALLETPGWRDALTALEGPLVYVDTVGESLGRDGGGGFPARAGVEDVAAAVSCARAVVSGDAALAAVAVGFGIPVAACGVEIEGAVAVETPQQLAAILQRLASSPAHDASPLQARLDADFDALATALLRAVPAAAHAAGMPGAAIDDDAYRLAYQSRTRESVALRRALESEIAALEVDAEHARSRHRDEVAALQAELWQWRDTAERVTTSKTWRWTEPAREAYRRARRRNPA
jgi:hypothetical protein